MSHPKPEWLAAAADGELRGWRRWLVARHAQGCPACAAEYRHQRHVRELLRENPRPGAMSDSAEFFWSKVRSEIVRQQPVPQPVAVDSRYSLQLATVLAAVMIAVGLFWVSGRLGPPRTAGPVLAVRPELVVIQTVSTPIPDTVATVLPAEEPGVTTVWISGLPWTKDMDEMMTVYANLDS